MDSSEKASVRRELSLHLEEYRSARWQASLALARGTDVPVKFKEEISFHAVRLAECLDRLDGWTHG